MRFRSIFLAIGLLMLVVACRQPDSESNRTGLPAIGERMRMVQFRMPSLTDNIVLDSKQLEGQVLLVNFFATWCPPCIQEIPTFISLQNSFKQKGFSVVAFSMDEGDPAPVKKVVEKYGINYPVLLVEPAVERGFGGIAGIPVSFLVNRKGEIVKKYLGYVEQGVLEEEIRKMLDAG
jgi:thiol-disulfide isomerase/thioredoxin